MTTTPTTLTPRRTETLEERDLRKRRRHVLGLDLVKQQDPSALSLLEYLAPGPAWIDSVLGPQPLKKEPRLYHIRALRRWPLQTGYLDVVANLVRIAKSGILPNVSLLVVDCTGVGDAVWESLVMEMCLARAPFNLVGVTITPGDGFRQREGQHGRWNVAKFSLASTLTVLLESRRLLAAPTLPEGRTFIKELENFTTKITPAGNETFEAARGAHDDVCMATATAAWAAENLAHPADGSVNQ
jgi:hypothetical protein